MRIDEILTYSFEELTTFTITESADGWEVSQSVAFKRGWKKHERDPRVVSAFEELMNFIKTHNTVPSVKSYPPQFYVHQTKSDKRFDTSLWAHLKGQKIGLLFSVEPGIIKLLHIGTHQELGWN